MDQLHLIQWILDLKLDLDLTIYSLKFRWLISMEQGRRKTIDRNLRRRTISDDISIGFVPNWFMMTMDKKRNTAVFDSIRSLIQL